ncbi:MAG: diacylglycerol kinase family lipid kinase [Thermodesulfovibrionales bacterium]|nr:diacylglycerol kinase family lipid kinase [Thermodesulfovibrionales bacterium]
MTKNIILIGNPIAGGGALKKIKRSVNILENRGFDVRLMLTAQKGDAESFARQISQEGQGELLVIAAGGDGTYNEVANGLAHSNIPMAILPLGTTSVLAKELNMPENLEKALNIALNGKVQTVHLGRITCNKLAHSSSLIDTNKKTMGHELSSKSYNITRHPSLVTRYFLLMAGIGFDGETVYSVNEKIKTITGKGAYILSGIRTILKYNPPRITLKYNSEQKSGYNAIIGKASCYGGDFKITPDAKLTEPSLYVFLMHKKGRLNLIRYISGIIKGGHLKLKDISYFRASEIEIQGNAHIQVDGDYLGITPAKIDVMPNALLLTTPTL